MKVEKLQWVSGLSSLQYLDMFWVNLSKGHDWLHVLKMLYPLSGRGLVHIYPHPSTINFISLDFSWNVLLNLPKWILNLTNLQSQ